MFYGINDIKFIYLIVLLLFLWSIFINIIFYVLIMGRGVSIMIAKGVGVTELGVGSKNVTRSLYLSSIVNNINYLSINLIIC